MKRGAFPALGAAVVIVSCASPDTGGTPRATAAAPVVKAPVVHTAPVNVAALDSLIAHVVKDKHLLGLSVGVMQDGKVVFDKGYGLRSVEKQEPVTPTTMFPIGSVTKQFTCAATLLLQEDGKLSMSDPVAKYVPSVTRARDVTLMDLGNQVTGYRDYYPLDFVTPEMQQPHPADTIIARYAMRPLDFEPGTRWSYSNTNFLLLGKAIEKASGMPVGDFMAKRIFTRLGMTRTSFERSPGDTGVASGYTSYALAAPTPAVPEGKGWLDAAGAIYSTTGDLLTWDLALIDGTLLSPASYATLTTPRTLTDGRSTGYGCGINVQKTGPAIVLQHGGAISGSGSMNIIIPATRSAVVVFANADASPVGDITSAVVAMLTPSVDVPTITGLTAVEAATAFLKSVERGAVDRATLGDDFAALATSAHLAADRASLASYGRVSDVHVTRTAERGGMEVAIVQFMVGKTPARAAMYRTPDGKIQQFLIYRQ